MLLSGDVSTFVSPPNSTQGAQVNSTTTEAENTSGEAIPVLSAVNTSTPPDNTQGMPVNPATMKVATTCGEATPTLPAVNTSSQVVPAIAVTSAAIITT